MNFFSHSASDFAAGVKVSRLPIVYALKTEGFEHVKIGKTCSPKQRFINIQSGCPFELTLWMTIRTPKADEIERVLHQKLKHCRTRGEWFSPSESDLDYLLDFFSMTNASVKEAARALL
jgi:hypothetical protein